ncbi:hypothetical protein ASD56_13190 [Microbacterium sp. Root166]|uniref:hypothetical protein n=1 Tax=Microbacterium sp. Root166 TaxID=1736478 RepID=UPI0006F2BC65|nr:hypothetical protein [Microbacterium sp. Root166]KQZ83259.1 hypothetical protein ASD56_13190 [Microbacterium sp. Root166]
MTDAARRPLPVYAWFFIGAGGAVAGLLPWLLSGARLPLQNLDVDGSSLAMPIAMLPFSQYYLVTIVALLVVGGAAAGIAGRALAPRRPRHGTTALVLGVLLVQVLAAAQAAVVTVGLLERSTRTLVYAGAVGAVIIVSLMMSTLVLLLIARAPVPGATIALSLAALVSASWIGAALHDVMILAPNEILRVIMPIFHWMPAVLVGCAIAWCGFRTGGRIAAVVVSLAALWIGPAFFTGVSSAAGTRVLAPYPAEMAEYGIQVFLSALTMPELALLPVAVALVIGVVGSLLLRTIRRPTPDEPEVGAEQVPAGERERA